MASAELSRRVEKVVGYPPLSELGDLQRRDFHEALREAGSFEDLPGKWQRRCSGPSGNRPKLRVVTMRDGQSCNVDHSSAARITGQRQALGGRPT